MYCKFFFFYCPSRILWTNFTKMMGERENPSDSIDYTVPQILLPPTIAFGIDKMHSKNPLEYA